MAFSFPFNRFSHLHCCVLLSLYASTTRLATIVVAQSSSDLDQWNYRGTIGGSNGLNDYGPSDWIKVRCSNVDTCVSIVGQFLANISMLSHTVHNLLTSQTGWADKVPNSQGWQIGSTNHCIWCPAGSKKCGSHHSSPINLDRNLNVVGSSIYNECIDGHWMAYFDSSCAYDELRELNAFTIERYGLTIKQPIGQNKENGGFYGIACNQQPGTGRRWGRVDFPKGFSQWWLLSHIDFHV
jgi:hypothetical protein